MEFVGFKLLIGISKCCVTQRGGDTHTLIHTVRTLTHTNGARLKGEVTLSPLQKLDTSQIQGLNYLFFSPCMEAKITQPMVKILTHKMLLRIFSIPCTASSPFSTKSDRSESYWQLQHFFPLPNQSAQITEKRAQSMKCKGLSNSCRV